MAGSTGKIIGSVLALMKTAEKISVIIEIGREKEGVAAVVAKRLIEIGVSFVGTDHYIFCVLTPLQIRTTAELKEVKYIWKDCPLAHSIKKKKLSRLKSGGIFVGRVIKPSYKCNEDRPRYISRWPVK